jgi:hypothetical protein
VAFDAGALDGEVRQVGRTFKHRAREHVKVYAGLEEEGAADEDALRNDDRSSATGCHMVDHGLDGLGVQGGAVRFRAELCDEALGGRRGSGQQRGTPEGGCKHQRYEPATIARMDEHNSPPMAYPSIDEGGPVEFRELGWASP